MTRLEGGVCHTASFTAAMDSDVDGQRDCKEVADVDGDGVVSLSGDVVAYTKAVLLAPASFGRSMDFDLDKDGVMNMADVIQEAKFVLITGLCQ